MTTAGDTTGVPHAAPGGRAPADVASAARIAAGALDDDTRRALAELLFTMADDEFVSGVVDSEWTGIAPILEEDVAMSSISQDELGHARALYELLSGVLDDGRDADALAYDRPPDAYRHARLLDRPRGDWADTIVRRFLYDLGDTARLSIVGPGFLPLADLVGKLRREERYHVMHARAWVERLARGGPDARGRLLASLDAVHDDAVSVLATLDGEELLLRAGILAASFAEAREAWRIEIAGVLGPLGIDWAPKPPDLRSVMRARGPHSEAFRRLHAEFTSVRSTEAGATW